MTIFRRPPRLREIVEPFDAAFPQPPSPPRKYPRTAITRILLMAMLPTLLPPIALALVTYYIGAPGTVAITSGALTVSLGLAITITTLMSRRDEDARMRADQHEYEIQRAEFEQSTAATAASAQAAVEREAAILAREFPAPNELVRRTLARTSTTWERRPQDDDFLELRLGAGSRSTCVRLSKEVTRSADLTVAPLVRRLTHHESVPVTVRLAPGARAGVFGEHDGVAELTAWLVLQSAAFHAPGELTIAVLSRDEALCGWAKWLPHCQLAAGRDSSITVARTSAEATAALRAISADIGSRAATGESGRYLVVADGRAWESLAARLERWLPQGADSV